MQLLLVVKNIDLNKTYFICFISAQPSPSKNHKSPHKLHFNGDYRSSLWCEHDMHCFLQKSCDWRLGPAFFLIMHPLWSKPPTPNWTPNKMCAPLISRNCTLRTLNLRLWQVKISQTAFRAAGEHVLTKIA